MSWYLRHEYKIGMLLSLGKSPTKLKCNKQPLEFLIKSINLTVLCNESTAYFFLVSYENLGVKKHVQKHQCLGTFVKQIAERGISIMLLHCKKFQNAIFNTGNYNKGQLPED